MYRHSYPLSPLLNGSLFPLILLILIILPLFDQNIMQVSAVNVRESTSLEFPIQRVEQLVRSAVMNHTNINNNNNNNNNNMIPTNPWEILQFISNSQTLEDHLLQNKHEWWCVVFLNISSQLLQTNAAQYIQHTLFPIIHAIQHTPIEPQSPFPAHIAIMDMQEASVYFDLYPFAHIFSVSQQSKSHHRPLDQFNILSTVEQMVRNGRVRNGLRSTLETPAMLIFRPGAAVYLREGRRWTEKQLAEQQNKEENNNNNNNNINNENNKDNKKKEKPLRMMAHGDTLDKFVSEVPPKTMEAQGGVLLQYLLSDYKRTVANTSSDNNINNNNNNNNNNNMNNNNGGMPPGILSEAQTQHHQIHLLEALRKIRERQEQHHHDENPYNFDTLKGKTPKERVRELISRIKKNKSKNNNNNDDDDDDDDDDDNKNDNNNINKELLSRQSTQMEKEEKDAGTTISKNMEQGKPILLTKDSAVREEYLRDDL